MISSQRMAWVGAPALFAGSAAGVTVAARQLGQQGEDDRGLGLGDVFIGLGVGAAATFGTLLTVSRLGAAGRPPAGRASSMALGGVVGSLLGVAAGMGISAVRGAAQADRRDSRIDAANDRLHDRLETAPDEATSWSIDGARDTSALGTAATGAAGLVGAGIGMQLHRVASGSGPRVALGALGLLAGGISAGAATREAFIRRDTAAVDDGVSSPVPQLPANEPVTEVARPEFEPGDQVTVAGRWDTKDYRPTPIRFESWATDRSYATEAEAKSAMSDIQGEYRGYDDDRPRSHEALVAFRHGDGYHLAYVTVDKLPAAGAKVPKGDPDVRLLYVAELEEGLDLDRELQRGWPAVEYSMAFDMDEDLQRDSTSVDVVFHEAYVARAEAAGLPDRGFRTEADALAAMRRTPGDQEIVEIGSHSDGDGFDYEALELPGQASRFLVMDVEPFRDARRTAGLRARDEDVELSRNDDQLRFHHRDVAREVDGVEMRAHDGWFLTPGEVTEDTFS